MNKGIALSGVITGIASFLSVTVVGLGFTFASSTTKSMSDLSEKQNETIQRQQLKDAEQDQNIGQLHTSLCIQNENQRNMAAAFHTPFVNDPNCK